MRWHSAVGGSVVLFVALGLAPLVALPVRARAGGPPTHGDTQDIGHGLALERSVARQLARLDDRLGLGTSPDGTGHWTARLAAALERRLEDPDEPDAIASHLLARLADDLRRLGVERDLDPPSSRPGVTATPEPPGRERVDVLEDVSEIARLAHAKLDRRESIEGKTAQIAPRVAPGNDGCDWAATISIGTVTGTTAGATVRRKLELRQHVHFAGRLVSLHGDGDRRGGVRYVRLVVRHGALGSRRVPGRRTGHGAGLQRRRLGGDRRVQGRPDDDAGSEGQGSGQRLRRCVRRVRSDRPRTTGGSRATITREDTAATARSVPR